MRRLLAIVTTTIIVLVAGCTSEYDDTAIWDEFDSVYERIDDIERLCTNLNNDIEALQTIITAIQNNDYVTSVVPIMQNGETIGYTISFSKSGVINIYHGTNGKDGADGKDGYTPMIGVRQDSSGNYFWTIDGEWLLDADGNKIPATIKGADGEEGKNGADGKDGVDGENGKDGEDGITPQLKIEDDYWYISYDNGETWEKLGKATGEDGANGRDGESLFEEITQDEEFVYFKLIDGSKLVIPAIANINNYRSLSISYIPVYEDGKALVEFTTPEDSYVVMDFEISPISVISDIAQHWDTLLDMKAVGVATRATTMINMEILSCESDTECGIITIKASGRNLGDEFFEGSQHMSARLAVNYGSTSHKSEYIPLITNNHLNYTPPTPTNNQFIYTTTDNQEIDLHGDFIHQVKSHTFEDGIGVITFNYPLTSIGAYHFYAKETLKSVVLPDSVETINESAFLGCSGLESITLGNGLIEIGQGAIGNCSNLTDIQFGNNVGYISDYAFSGCSNLTTITLPDSITEMGDGVFDGCTLLQNVDLGNGVKKIGYGTFLNCKSLTSITIPDCVTSLGNNTFDGCSSLKVAKIGNGLETLPEKTFKECTSLQSVTLGNSIKSIEGYAIENCTNLIQINFPSSLKYIGESALSRCEKLRSISLVGTTDLVLDMGAFSGCTKLESANLGTGVISIKQYAFRDCGLLESITIPESVQEMGGHIFLYCNSLKDIYLMPTTPPTAIIDHTGWSCFEWCSEYLSLHIAAASRDAYCAADGWKDYINYYVL